MMTTKAGPTRTTSTSQDSVVLSASRGRRGNGEGSITQLKDGRWQARIDLGYVEGKRKRKTYYGKTRKEAADKLKLALADHKNGLPLVDERQTMAQYLSRWLEDSARHTIRPRTYTRYEQLVRLHAAPYIGKIALARLTPQQLANLYSERLKAGQSPRSVQFLHAVLHRALKQALKWGLIARNPADAVDAPRPERKDIQPLTREQVTTFLIAIENDPLEALYVLAVTTGMRIGELLGLQWNDIEGNRLSVRHTLQQINKEWKLVEPKTDRSRRNITLTTLAVEALRHHRVKQNEQRLAIGAAWQNRDLVFCNAAGAPLDARNILRSNFHPLLARAGLPKIRLHDLRHTAATLLLSAGTHPKKVQDLLGHSTISLTLDTYSHILPSMQDEVASAMDGLLRTKTQSA